MSAALVNAALDVLIAAGLLLFAFRAVTVREPGAAVASFIGLGLVLTLAWVRLAAPDVALTEAALGSGVTGLVLFGAVAAGRTAAPAAAASAPGRSDPRGGGAPGGGPTSWLAATAGGLVFAGLAAIVSTLPDPAPSLAPAVAGALPASGLGNAVTAVLIVFRAFDTLLETVVLLLALVGVWSLARRSPWRGVPAPALARPPSGALVFLARVLVPAGVLYGIYQFWAGADHPGGAFQGGAVLASMGLVAVQAGILRPPAIERGRLRLALVAGPAGFLGVGIAGWFVAGGFLAYPAGVEKAVIVAVEVAITLSIGVTLGLLVLGPPGEDSPGEDSSGEDSWGEDSWGEHPPAAGDGAP